MTNNHLLSDNSYTREQELIMAEKKLVGVRMGIETLTQKIIIIENLILDGNTNSMIQSRVILLNSKLNRLKSKIKEDIDRIVHISSTRHTTKGEDVDFIDNLEKKYLLDINYEKLLAVRLVTVTENFIYVAGVEFDRFDINPEDGSKTLILGHSLVISL